MTSKSPIIELNDSNIFKTHDSHKKKTRYASFFVIPLGLPANIL
jgi:hypothetical protein